MAFQTPLTINEVITSIHTKKYLLPSIQREFVWSTDQITMLFDSLMRNYPINAFLFWKVAKENINEFRFYEFLRDYHQLDKRHNEEANIGGNDDVIAILDGQQRLTSLYIGLKGTYAYRLKYRSWNDKKAYPLRKLYLNLLSKSDDPEYEYQFDFLTDIEAKNKQGDIENHWFLVGTILDLKEPSEVNDYLIENDLSSNPDKEKAKFANRALFKLHEVIHTTPTISYFLEQSKELDKVLNIFIRANKGGTTLSYSDLLLSIATAQWDKRDARKEITQFVDDFNSSGRGFNFNKDAVLKACLVLSDFNDISFKVDNFNKSNMLEIQDKWDDIKKALQDAATLISSFGFSRENITSNNLIIPIAYYLKHIGLPDNFETNSNKVNDRAKIKKWFTLSLLKSVFSFMPDGVLKPVREIINVNTTGEFPLDEIIQKFKGGNRNLIFTKDEINNLMYSKYGQGDTLIIMSILYPWADFRNNFHIDHMFPKSGFTRKRLEKFGIPQSDIDYYMTNFNYIGNLQLLESIPNIQKSSMDFDKWIAKTIPAGQLDDYKTKHFIPKNINLDITNFKVFLEERELMIIQKLESELL